jgi:predicted nucleic acid-binding protein
VNPDEVPDGPVVVDTDVATWLHTGRGEAERFGPLVANHVLCMAFATVGELRFGALKAGWGERRCRELDAFIRNFVVLPVDDAVTAVWARSGRSKRRVDRRVRSSAESGASDRDRQCEASRTDVLGTLAGARPP